MTPPLLSPRRVVLHSASSALTRGVLWVFVLLVLAGCGLAALAACAAGSPPHAFGVACFGGVFAWMMSGRLRYMPEVYGDPRGMDLRWAWGDRRHVDWHEVVEIRVNRLSSPQARRFRVYLTDDEALEFDARADFAEVIAPWREQAEPPAEG